MMEEDDDRWLGWVPVRPALFVLALWLGGQMGGLAALAGRVAASGRLDSRWLVGAALAPLESLWGMMCCSLPVIWAFAVLFFRQDEVWPKTWTVFACLQSWLVFGHQVSRVSGTAGWIGLLVLLFANAALVAGIGLLRQWRMQRLGNEWRMIRAENECRRAEKGGREAPAPED